MAKLEHPSAERNKQPILDVLRRVLPARGTVLEIAGGSGQHAVFFAENLPCISWLPTDVDDERLASIGAWREASNCSNLLEPRRLDVLDEDWGIGAVDVVFSANMVHITPWECCLGLLAGARRHLTPGGLLIFYGPFSIGGEHTAQSNAAFDEDLRGRDPSWGVRDLDAICDAADGFFLHERVEMPANNQMLVFRLVEEGRLDLDDSIAEHLPVDVVELLDSDGYDTEGYTTYNHTGFWGTMAVHVPELDLTIAATVNQNQLGPIFDQIPAEVIRIVKQRS